jgi:YVTN family beta-propeller protein
VNGASMRHLGLVALVVASMSPARAENATPAAVLVVNTQDASISRIDLDAMKEVARHPVGQKPYGIAVTRDGQTVAVGVEGEEEVKFFAAEDFAPRGEVRIGPMYNDHIVLSPDGKHVLVANFHSDDVVGIDVSTMTEAFRIEGASAPHVVKIGPLGKHAYVTCKKVTGIAIIDPGGRTLVKSHPLNVNPRSLTFAPDESRLYFGSFWVDGFFEMDPAAGKVTRLIHLAPPADNAAPQEVTYHGVEAIGADRILAANEGRSYVDLVEPSTGKLLDRLHRDVSKPCCIERIPGTAPPRALVSNIGNGTVTLVEVAGDGKLAARGTVTVGAAPKRVAFVPARAKAPP